jgi:Lipocalin-like domain
MNQLNRFLIFFFASAVLFSCQKVEVEKNTDPQGYADSQIVGSWKIVSISSDKPFDWDGNGAAETDIYNTWSECDKDNLFLFDGTKTGVYKFTCNLTKSGTWNMLDRFRIIIYADGAIPQEELIRTLTSNEFKTSSYVTATGGQIFEISKVWQRQ